MTNFTLPYNITSPLSIEKYAKQLIGLTFEQAISAGQEYLTRICPEQISDGITLYNGKGGLGQLLEKYYFMYNPNSDAAPDFAEAGVELKVTPYKQNANHSYSPKERLVLNIINYEKIVYETFEESSFWYKNKLILLVYYLYQSTLDKLEYPIHYVQLFSIPEEDLLIIKQDWEKIVAKVRAGKAHELSEGDTFYLGACSKGANRNSVRKQPYSNIPAMQRAFCLKTKYMKHVLNNYLMSGITTYEPIVKSNNHLQNQSLEDFVTKLLSSYAGKSIEELMQYLNLSFKKRPKNITSLIILRLLGISSPNAKEFELGNVKIKTIRLKHNETIKEHMSFPTFEFCKLVTEEWESSELRAMFEETKFLFVIYRFDEHDVLRLHSVKFWNMPLNDLDSFVKDTWILTQKVISEGIQLIQKGSRTFNNLPVPSFNGVCHVRPHAQNKKDTYPLPTGGNFTKQCFWLDRAYILKQLSLK